MANSDYTIRATGQSFCPIANLDSAVTAFDSVFNLFNVRMEVAGSITVGMALMVDDEICKITSISGETYGVLRGCADTIPAPHSESAEVWFLDAFIGSDFREYFPTESVGLKLLPKITSATTPIAYAPALPLTFAQRFQRPYPPGQMRANGQIFTYAGHQLTSVAPELSLTWVGRNRITQADQLIGHAEDGVTPEVGTTYRVRLFTAGGTLVKTYEGITESPWVYHRNTMIEDFNLDAVSDTGMYPAYLMFAAMRDGLACWQEYRIDFECDTTGIPKGSIALEDGSLLLQESGGFKIFKES